MSVEHRRPVRATGVAVLLAFGGIVLSVLLSIPAFFIIQRPLGVFVWATVLSELGFVAAAAIFLGATGRGLSYLDLRVPTLRQVGYAVAGVVVLLVYRQVAIAAALFLDLPLAGNSLTEFPGLDVLSIVAVLVPISILVIGPAEEILFRGVVQNYLAEHFSEWGAIGIASVVFAAVHAPTSWVATPDPGAVGVTLLILFGLSVVLGWLYVRTDNLLVPILVHGLYDAAIFALAYWVLSTQKLPVAF